MAAAIGTIGLSKNANLTLAEWEQKGYDAWIELWAQFERSPSVSQCPARWMEDGEQRQAYIRGWVRAKNEFVNI